jgi:hypothetical protein
LGLIGEAVDVRRQAGVHEPLWQHRYVMAAVTAARGDAAGRAIVLDHGAAAVRCLLVAHVGIDPVDWSC